jgi:hypothetical protein
MPTAVKTERITILGTPDFKDFLTREAKKEGVSLSELVRQRCEKKPTSNEDEDLLTVLVEEVRAATARAKVSLGKGLDDAEKVLAEIRRAAA